MATGTMKWFGLAPKTLLAKEVDFLNDTIKGMLTTVTYVPDQDAHDYKSDVTNEVSGTGYTAGGATLANKTVTYTAGTNVGKAEPFPRSRRPDELARRQRLVTLFEGRDFALGGTREGSGTRS